MTQRDTYSEAWRAECEARYVANLPQAERGDYLRGVAKVRGKPAATALREAAKAVWASRQPEGGKSPA